MGELDIDGTKKMADDIYGSLTKYGAKSYLILNRVAGFCTPNPDFHHANNLLGQESNVGEQLAKTVGMKVISSIPCYCDIQFSRREYLTVLKHPEHPFTNQISSLIEENEIKV